MGDNFIWKKSTFCAGKNTIATSDLPFVASKLLSASEGEWLFFARSLTRNDRGIFSKALTQLLAVAVFDCQRDDKIEADFLPVIKYSS